MRSSTEPRVLGIDLGTSRLKVVLVDQVGHILSLARAGYPTSRSVAGIAEQNPNQWWAALREAMASIGRTVPIDFAGVAAIGVTGQMHGVVAADESGRPVRPCMTWEDYRAIGELDGVRKRISGERVCLLSGSPLSAGFTAGLARWLTLHEPESMCRSRWLLQPKDWIRFMLTGEAATEPSDASGTLLFDVMGANWSSELMAAFEVEPRLLPPVIPSSSVAGTILPRVARDLGLPGGLPVVAGGGDSPTAALGAGIRGSLHASRGLISFGTAAQIAIATDRPKSAPHCAYQLFRHVIDGEWLQVAAIPSAGSSIAWLARILLPHLDEGIAIEQLIAEAAHVPPGARGVTFIPQLVGRRSPTPEPEAAGAFAGLRIHHGRSEITRAVLEGVGFALRDGLDGLRAQGFKPRVLSMVGGLGSSDVWPQILAGILDVRICRSPDGGGAALGAAALAAEGAGIASADSLTRVAIGETLDPLPADVSTFRAIHETRWAKAVAAL